MKFPPTIRSLLLDTEEAIVPIMLTENPKDL